MVGKFINDNFDLSAVDVSPCPLLPAGQVVKDKRGGQMIVYYDLLSDKVKTMFPSLEEVK